MTRKEIQEILEASRVFETLSAGQLTRLAFWNLFSSRKFNEFIGYLVKGLAARPAYNLTRIKKK